MKVLRRISQKNGPKLTKANFRKLKVRTVLPACLKEAYAFETCGLHDSIHRLTQKKRGTQTWVDSSAVQRAENSFGCCDCAESWVKTAKTRHRRQRPSIENPDSQLYGSYAHSDYLQTTKRTICKQTAYYKHIFAFCKQVLADFSKQVADFCKKKS